MGALIFLAVTVLGGILFVINGANILLSDCAAVTFDDSRRITGRSFLIQATCLSNEQANASDIPAWMGGWGMILLGLASMSAFIWLTPILAFIDQRRLRRAQAAFNRRPSIPAQMDRSIQSPVFGVMSNEDLAQVARQVQSETREFRREFKRRTEELSSPSIREQDAISVCRELLPRPLQADNFELAWIFLGNAANIAELSHENLWLNVRNSSVLRVNRQDPLDRIALAWRGKNEPPYPYMTNKQGQFLSPYSDLISAD